MYYLFHQLFNVLCSYRVIRVGFKEYVHPIDLFFFFGGGGGGERTSQI